ncbi:hypothetical protein LY76DRAFT_380680 [Colletotrichum caudatum]|nr:hypothetical protein LY76DRAFT_380680 [Colletotrichum caudatum]
MGGEGSERSPPFSSLRQCNFNTKAKRNELDFRRGNKGGISLAAVTCERRGKKKRKRVDRRGAPSVPRPPSPSPPHVGCHLGQGLEMMMPFPSWKDGDVWDDTLSLVRVMEKDVRAGGGGGEGRRRRRRREGWRSLVEMVSFHGAGQRRFTHPQAGRVVTGAGGRARADAASRLQGLSGAHLQGGGDAGDNGEAFGHQGRC